MRCPSSPQSRKARGVRGSTCQGLNSSHFTDAGVISALASSVKPSGILDKTGHVPLGGDEVCFEIVVCGEDG
jgi:hypothetical protein